MKKLFTLLTLLVVAISASAAVTTTHTPGKYESAEGYNTALTTYGGRDYEVYYLSQASNKNYLGVGKSWVSASSESKPVDLLGAVTYNAQSKTVFDFTDGWGSFVVDANFSGSSTSSVQEWGSSQSTHYVALKSTTSVTLKVSGYDQFSFAGRDNHASNAGKQLVVTIDGVEQSFTHTSSDWNVYRFDISTEEHTIVITGNGSDANRFRGFSLRLPSASSAPATPEFTPNGGDVNGGSKTTIASTDAQKIYYAWTSSSEAPAQDAENTWTEASGASYEFTIPNETATMYLHAYGWNSYNTSSTSSTKTSNAFNVTKVKQEAGLAYATTAVAKNINDANFTNALTNPNDLTVTYSVVEGATATGVAVNATTGEVTVGSVGGTATIKASFAGNDDYNAGEASYTLTVSVPDPTVTVTPVTVSSTATAGNIAFAIGYPVEGGVVTAAEVEDADWLTLGAVGDGTVAFTTEVNNGFASRYAKVNVTYTYNTNQTVTKPVMVSQEPNTVGTSIIKVPVQDATHAGTITGSIGGTATVALQNSAVAGGYKFGGNGNNITLTLADDNTFQTGDVIIIHTTQAGELSNGYITIFDGNNTSSSNTVLYTETQGSIGINGFILPSEANGKKTISVMRKNNSGDYLYNWNGYVDYVEVLRNSSAITLGAGGYSTYAGAANFTVSGAKALTAQNKANSVGFTEIAEGTVIPANTGVVLQGTEGDEVTITFTSEDASSIDNNDMVGVTEANPFVASDNVYVIATKAAGTKFYKYTGATFPVGKAYLNSAANTDALDIDFGQATAVEAVAEANAEASAPIKVIKNGKLFIGNYNVAGQQVK